jgi:hypothetical protein
MGPLFEHYGIQLWTPEVGARIDFHAEDHEQTMLALGLQPKREIARTRLRVRTAMAIQTREQGRYLGGRLPYGYQLADAGPHPTRRTPPGAAGRTGWSRTRTPRRWWRGCSPSGWPGTAPRGSLISVTVGSAVLSELGLCCWPYEDFVEGAPVILATQSALDERCL